MSRHSSFSRSSAPRPWRSPSKPTDPQASLSLVFAEPEHSASGGTAAATLLPKQESDNTADPSLHRLDCPNAASLLRKASYASLRSLSKRARKDSAAPDLSVNTEMPSTRANSEVPPEASQPPEPVGVDQASIPVRSQAPNHRSASRQPSQQAGWYSSLGRKPMDYEESMRPVDVAVYPEDASKVVLSPQVAVQPTTAELPTFESTQSPTGAVPFPTSDHTPSKAVTEAAKSRSQPGGWFSGKALSYMTPVATILRGQAPEDAQSSSETLQVTLPSDVIARKPSPPQDIPQTKEAGSDGESSRPKCPRSTTEVFLPSSVDDSVPIVSSFSPPSSPTPVTVRPRERTLSNLSSLNPSSSRFILSMPLLGRPKVPLNQIVARVEEAGSASGLSEITKGTPPEAEKLENVQDGAQTPRGSTVSGTSSWWGYLGLASSSSVELPPPSLPDTPSSPVNTDSPTSVLPSVTETQNPSIVRSQVESEPPTTPSSVFAESASTWYMPWRWYGGTVIPPALEPLKKTQAELIKEDALARSESLFSGPEPANLVISSVESRTSWASFFSQSVSAHNVGTIKGKDEVVDVKNVDDADSIVPGSRVGSSTASTTKSPASPTFKGPPEPLKLAPTAPPLTKDDDLKNKVQGSQRPSSVSSKKSIPSPPPHRANLVLPTFEDTFSTPPRSIPISQGASAVRRTIRYVSGILFPEENRRGKGKGGDTQRDVIGRELPRMWSVLGEHERLTSGGLDGVKRVVVIGIHGWFPGSIIRQVLGEPTGTSRKFANMLASAVEDYVDRHGAALDKLTKIVLEGEGTIERRVNSLYQEYLNHEDWVEDLQKADAILLATHSQGSIVSTQLLHKLISEGHIRTPKSGVAVAPQGHATTQRICCVAMCGIHLGPLLFLNTSSLVNPYIQYFESAAARELFEFQDSESPVSQTYIKALKAVLEHGVKFTYIASLNDQVVPIYSGCFSTVAHPLILRALYIDGDAYSSSDFLSNLLVLLLRIRNAGLDDGGLITHLSEATAGSLSGVGHSSAYEEPATYSLAVRFLFETSGALGVQPELAVQPFTARAARNDYEIPWTLRDLIANPDVASLFSSEISELRAAFDDWHPRTTVLREIRRKLEPIRRLPTSRL